MAEQMICQQCGRIGVRGFRIFPVAFKNRSFGTIIECSARKACQRRYERQRPVRDGDA